MSLFDFVKQSVSILDVIGSYVTLKRAGTYYKGSCPFHNETDASFTVSPDRHIFYCFGCQAGGDAIAFIAQAENMSQGQAVRHLIDRYRVNVPTDMAYELQTQTSSQEKDRYFKICEAVTRWAQHKIQTTPEAMNYLLDRNIKAETIIQFEIGYFPGGTQKMALFLKEMSNRGFLVSDLAELGIILAGRNGYYSPFEDRIIFPIKDPLGRHCAFGGRIFQANDERPKYYNSKESEIFSKRQILFGLDRAKKEMQQTGQAFLVEGYMDCIAMAQHGHSNTIATLGTACSIEHLKLLSRHVHTLFVMYDGDKAGQAAIGRLTELCWNVDIELKVVQLPPKEDPASFLAKSGDIAQLIAHSIDIFSFFVQSVSADFARKPMHEKLEICRKITEMISTIKNGIKQHLLLQQTSLALQVPLAPLKKMMFQSKKAPAPEPTQVQSAQKEEEKGLYSQDLEKTLVSAILNSAPKDTTITQLYQELREYFSLPVQEFLARFYELHDTDPAHALDTLINSLSESERAWALSLIMQQHETLEPAVLQDFADAYKKQCWKLRVHTIRTDLLMARQKGDLQRTQELMESFLRLKREMQNKGLV